MKRFLAPLALLSSGCALWFIVQGQGLGESALFWSLVTALVAGIALLGQRTPESSWLGQAPLSGMGLLVAILGVALASAHPMEWDWTKNRVESLAPETIALLESLEEDVEATLFFLEMGMGRTEAESLFEKASRFSPHLKWRMVNPRREPLLTNELGAREGTILLQSKGRTSRMNAIDEEALSNALLGLRGSRRIACFSRGHGEPPLHGDEGLGISRHLLQEKGIGTADVDLFKRPEVGCDVLILVGPTGVFQAPELETLSTLMNEIGLVILFEPGMGERYPLLDWLEGNGLMTSIWPVLDPLSQEMGFHPFQVLALSDALGKHPITSGIAENLVLSVVAVVGADENWESTPLVLSGDWTWEETDLEADEAQFDEGERNGPLPLALAAVEGDKRVVLVGDHDFVTDQVMEAIPSSGDLFLGMVRWSIGKGEIVALPPRDRGLAPLSLKAGDVRRLGFLYAGAILLLLGHGLGTHIARRRR